MTVNVPTHPNIERVIFVTVDCLRWDYHTPYKDLYPNGVWYRGVPQATYTPNSHGSAFTGANPPRHAAHDFGTPIQIDCIFDATDSISFSKITDRWSLVETPGLPERPCHIPFAERDEMGDTWQFQLRPMNPADYDALADYDFAFIHDWIVHGSGSVHDSHDWATTIEWNGDSEYNHAQYANHIEMSERAHQGFLDTLKDKGLYKDSLFVVWGDHGQALSEQPLVETGHNHYPEDEVARVPIGFCSPLFEETETDAKTNARSIDIVPTLKSVFEAAGLSWEALSHDPEGVDLTTFNGSLVGYSMGRKTVETGAFDGVKSATHSMLMTGEQVLTEYKPDQYERVRQAIAENPLVEQKLEQMYQTVRAEPAQLIARHEPEDTEFLRDMGYLE